MDPVAPGATDDADVDELRGPPGFLNSCEDAEGELRLDGIREWPELAGAGEAGTPSMPIRRFGSSSRCFTSE